MKKLVTALAVVTIIAAPAFAQTLTDIDDHPQASVIRQAVADGYFQGYEDGTFQPDRAISPGQVAKVFSRAFPDGVTRAEMAQVMISGQAALAGSNPDLADPPAGGQSGTGLLLSADLPVIRVENHPYSRHSYHPDVIVETWLELCHITQTPAELNTTNNLKNACMDMATHWRAYWVYVPEGFDRGNLFLHAELDGELERVPFRYIMTTNRHGRCATVSKTINRCRFPIHNIDRLVPKVVRDVPGRMVDVRIECIRYKGWSDEPVKSKEDIPYEPCFVEDTE